MRLKEIKPGMVIHCKTEEELKTLLDELTVLGYIWWGDGAPPNRISHFAPILINTYEDSGVGKNITYSEVKEKTSYTEFSDLIIPELSAKEVLEVVRELCVDRCCDDCIFYHNHCPFSKEYGDLDKVIDICTKWREEHPKEEKKELETEWVYVIRIIKVHDNGKKECVHEVDYGPNKEYNFVEDFLMAKLKEYCSEHEGNFFAVYERVCRIKE